MKTQTYLTFSKRGALRVTKKKPALRSGEFAVLLRLTVPDRLFEPAIPIADVTVTPDAVIAPVDVSVIVPAETPSPKMEK